MGSQGNSQMALCPWLEFIQGFKGVQKINWEHLKLFRLWNTNIFWAISFGLLTFSWAIHFSGWLDNINNLFLSHLRKTSTYIVRCCPPGISNNLKGWLALLFLNKISEVVVLDYQLCVAYCTLQNVAFFCHRLGVDYVRSGSLKKCTQRLEGPQAGPHTVHEQNIRNTCAE